MSHAFGNHYGLDLVYLENGNFINGYQFKVTITQILFYGDLRCGNIFIKLMCLQLSTYENELEEMKKMTRLEFVASLRRYWMRNLLFFPDSSL